MSISRSNIEDQIAALLYSMGIVNNNEHVEMELDLPEIVPLKLKITKEQEVRLVEYGKGST